MTMRRRTVRRPGAIVSGTAGRPRYTWRGFESGVFTMVQGTTAGFVVTTSGPGATLSALGVIGDYTVRRVLGRISAVSIAAAENNSVDFLTWGLYVAENDAIGIPAFPEPRVDPADWFGYGTVLVPLHGVFSVGTHPPALEHFDTRAMRKINENHQGVVMVFESPPALEANINVNVVGRILVSHGRR